MRALLGVAQGSARPARVVVMEWMNGPAEVKPVAFVGKGVVFDTGGISIKPAGGMEDMKGDMAGAAAVVGTMHALAARKAKVNAVGVIGLVENMPDGNAQRPGDIVKSKSGQTIEIINTDAEGRLVLADCLTWTIETYKPRVVIDLATLTGAVIVALGHFHAGLYTDDDTVAAQLVDAGKATGDLVWRMPLSKDYDGLIDSKVADMKNTGGRWAGSIHGSAVPEALRGRLSLGPPRRGGHGDGRSEQRDEPHLRLRLRRAPARPLRRRLLRGRRPAARSRRLRRKREALHSQGDAVRAARSRSSPTSSASTRHSEIPSPPSVAPRGSPIRIPRPSRR